MLGVAAQRIAWLIRKPRNNADECHCAETRRDGAQLPTARAICRRAARPWGLPRASRRFAHLIPESLRRGHAGLIQRFPKCAESEILDSSRRLIVQSDAHAPLLGLTVARVTLSASRLAWPPNPPAPLSSELLTQHTGSRADSDPRLLSRLGRKR